MFRLVKKGFKSLKKYGIRVTARRVWRKFFRRGGVRHACFRVWTEKEYAAQRAHVFDRDVTFSIAVPLYNTPEPFLRAMIDSVRGQTYAKWQLCLADGSDGEHARVGEICRGYAAKDGRICYRKLEKNGGISENSNAALAMAEGEYIGLLDHDDLLHPAALYCVMRAVCEEGADFVYTDEATFTAKGRRADGAGFHFYAGAKGVYNHHFKPDFAPDNLRAINYICHFTAFARPLLAAAGGGFRHEYDGSQDFDLILRLTERAQKIVHVPEILYFWRAHASSTAQDLSSKPYVLAAGRAAVAAHLRRTGLQGEVEDGAVPSTYRVRYAVEGEPLISVVIPNKDGKNTLRRCLASLQKSTWKNYEIVIAENNSTDPATFDYYKELEADPRIRVVGWEGPFNYSAINNYAVRFAKGEYLLFLNNDVEVISPQWMEEMLMFAQRQDVGGVGAMLYYFDDTVQHAGVILGTGGIADHAHKYFRRGRFGYMGRLTYAQDVSAVTAACMLVPRRVFEEVGGFDESFAVAFNDIDFCMRIRETGRLIVWTPHAELYHYESKTRGRDDDSAEKRARFEDEVKRFRRRWRKQLEAGDPYYNPNLTLLRPDFSVRSKEEAEHAPFPFEEKEDPQ